MNDKIKNIYKRLKNVILLTIKKAMDPYFAGTAAEVGFFLLMSLVPTTILLAQILNIFELSMDVIENLLLDYVNNDVVQILLPYIDYSPSGAVNIVLIALAFWGGSKSLFSLMRITNYAYLGGNPSKNPLTGYIKERIRAIITILIILFTLVFAINIVIFGKVFVEAILSYLNEYLDGDYNVSIVWLNIRWILGFLLYFFMVASIYYLLPNSGYSYRYLWTENRLQSIKNIFFTWASNAKQTIKTIFPGSIFASIGMLVATWVYSIYLGNITSSNFDILYGSLSAVVMLLLWFYILSYILILGIQINSIWEESKEIGTEKGEKNEERK